MENTKINERLVPALAHKVTRNNPRWIKEREANRKKNAYYKESIRASMKRRMEQPKNKASSRVMARLKWLLVHPNFKLGKFPPANGRAALSLQVILGCGAIEFREHIQSLFHSGMSWANYGSTWHVGHRTPIRLFNCADDDQLKACFHFKNLQPEIPIENQRRLNEKPFNY